MNIFELHYIRRVFLSYYQAREKSEELKGYLDFDLLQTVVRDDHH